MDKLTLERLPEDSLIEISECRNRDHPEWRQSVEVYVADESDFAIAVLSATEAAALRDWLTAWLKERGHDAPA